MVEYLISLKIGFIHALGFRFLYELHEANQISGKYNSFWFRFLKMFINNRVECFVKPFLVFALLTIYFVLCLLEFNYVLLSVC